VLSAQISTATQSLPPKKKQNLPVAEKALKTSQMLSLIIMDARNIWVLFVANSIVQVFLEKR
jgi:hypothetical protein